MARAIDHTQGGSFMGGVNDGLTTGLRVMQTYQTAKDRREKDELKAAMKDAATGTPTEVVGRSAAMAGLDQAYANAQAAGITPEQEKTFGEVRAALESRPEAATYEFRGKTQAQPFTAGQVDAGHLAEQANVLAQHGDPLNATRLRVAGAEYESAERKRADEQELRGAMSGGLTIGTAPGGAAQAPGQPFAQGAGTSTATPGTAGANRSDLNAYLNRIAPRTMETLLKQGKVTEAKAFRDFVDSEDGKAYTSRWAAGMRKHAIGDTQGAVKDFMGLFNDQLYDDGHTVNLVPLENGQFRAEFFAPDGKKTWSRDGTLDQFADQAALMLAPEKAVEFYAKQSAQRHNDAADLVKEDRRDQRAEDRDDRRDERLNQRFRQERELLGMKQSASGALTAPQQRSNLEIDAARDMVSGLSPQEIQRRTAKTTDTGRENRDYDPALARAASLAGRRKVGDDPDFDGRQRRSGTPAAAASPGVDRDAYVKRFRADSSMNRFRAGALTPKGIEVFDSTGKLVGYYD